MEEFLVFVVTLRSAFSSSSNLICGLSPARNLYLPKDLVQSTKEDRITFMIQHGVDWILETAETIHLRPMSQPREHESSRTMGQTFGVEGRFELPFASFVKVPDSPHVLPAR